MALNSSLKMLISDLKALVFAFIIAYNLLLATVSSGQLQVGFYSRSCPAAESIVQSVVNETFQNDNGSAAVLLRLQFHDCFVEGCDASILIDNGEKGERNAAGNLGVRGFEIIEAAKSKLEGVCPGVVSCADIVALAARDAVSLVDGPFYQVPTGRRDGRVSSKSLASNLPEVDDSIQLLKSKFREKGLSEKDLVLLSGGAHTIGVTACFFMQVRLYNFTPRGGSDPAIDPRFLQELKAKCPFQGNLGVQIPLDPVTDFVFDDQIFRNIKNGFAVIASDARLSDDQTTKQILESYIRFRNSSSGLPSFKADFAQAIVKMGSIGVKTGLKGEIRRVCSTVN
ncbi:Peroxidase [Melia azedarach]|uniref:Peroxidase n=1 Tax=Melia azedarach TaxID=155640 RepID=A0ACC1WPH6_MELAZ|nr:Peroxidase [Melia azedarach]